MAHGIDLLRLAFAIEETTELLPVRRPGDAAARAPEVAGFRLVSHAGKHARLLAALDLPKSVAAELEVVALLIDGKTAIALNQNAVVHSGDQRIQADFARSGFQPYIGHALERHAAPGIGVAAAAGFLLTHQVRLVANSLV